MQASTVLLLLVFTFARALPDIQHAHTVNFRDDFSGFNKDVWRCEYDCPVIQDGKAHFHLRAGIPPNSYGSWSKSYYTPHRFTLGRFTARISQSERSKGKVWWGVALWDNGPEKDGSKYNEINFGCTTDEDNKNSELSFESTKHGNHESVKVDVGVDLYDGHFHNVALDYNHTRVQLWFDGKMIKEVTNKDVIPTDPMDLVLGTRHVHGGSPLEKEFTETVDWIEIAA